MVVVISTHFACQILHSSSNTPTLTYTTHSYYKVFAVPVRKGEGQPDKVVYTPKVPLKDLPSHAISFHLASKVSEPIPFVIGQYNADYLPEKLTLGGRWMKAFKPEVYYSIVVFAFTKTAVSFPSNDCSAT